MLAGKQAIEFAALDCAAEPALHNTLTAILPQSQQLRNQHLAENGQASTRSQILSEVSIRATMAAGLKQSKPKLVQWWREHFWLAWHKRGTETHLLTTFMSPWRNLGGLQRLLGLRYGFP